MNLFMKRKLLQHIMDSYKQGGKWNINVTKTIYLLKLNKYELKLLYKKLHKINYMCIKFHIINLGLGQLIFVIIWVKLLYLD